MQLTHYFPYQMLKYEKTKHTKKKYHKVFLCAISLVIIIKLVNHAPLSSLFAISKTLRKVFKQVKKTIKDFQN